MEFRQTEALHPDLMYGQVIKKKRQGRLVKVTTRIVCGAKRLASLGLTISTSLLERLNLTYSAVSGTLGAQVLEFQQGTHPSPTADLLFPGVLQRGSIPHESQTS